MATVEPVEAPAQAPVSQAPDRRRAALWLALALLLLVGWPLLARWDARRGADVGDGVLVAVPDAPRWWAGVAACLGDPLPYPAGVRFYVGSRVPSGWRSASESAPERYGGYTDVMGKRVMLARYAVRASAIVAHEVWHVIHGGGHPARVFGDASRAPRCGLARP